MSSQSDRDGRGMRRRPRRGGRGGGPERQRKEEYGNETSEKPRPIILAKPSQEQGSTSTTAGVTPSVSGPATPSALGSKTPEKMVMLRNRDDVPSAPTGNLTSIPASLTSGETPPPQPTHTVQRNQHFSSESSSQNRLAPPPEMTRCTKLVDESQMWQESAMEMLVDQTDFLVVGVIGPQGSGKSTALSLLAGNSPEDNHRQFLFPPQTHDTIELCEHQTSGVDMFVSGERVIFLDTQPVMSSSVLDRMIRHDKKIGSEYSTAENCIEIQSLQQAAFLMNVCHVVLVVQDWFTDTSFLRFLLTAEMLKPSSPSSNHDNPSEDSSDYFPNLVFIQNKAVWDHFSVETFNSMQQTLMKVFETSKLKYRGSVTVADGKMLPGLNRRTVKSDINLYPLPCIDSAGKSNQEAILTLLPEYRGYPSFTTLINGLRQQIYALPREQLTHTTLSEKNWFHYAARTWDAVKKSQLMAEYNRLLH
ncbi:nonsense-mediated mRNA decay factor SMG9-like [Ylistrum balloti]|uniref:nonsense-mediated mRNA decay factor SMG9-like n=1 Tax=Ylistrum balloti TaxID=509963 RepID=UPI002905C9E4|nr:nonsense-mediated mRNA decay factor SMG9-like [Ylistrum balloti]